MGALTVVNHGSLPTAPPPNFDLAHDRNAWVHWTVTCGALIIAIVVFLNRMGNRFHSDLRIRHCHP